MSEGKTPRYIDTRNDQMPEHTGPHGERFWLFYCWRCDQWCEQEGPWCALYKSEPRTSPCHFDEYPDHRGGVEWQPFDFDVASEPVEDLPQ